MFSQLMSVAFLAASLAFSGAQAQSCEVEGSCGQAGNDNFIANGFTETQEECEQLCTDQSGEDPPCTFYTFFPEDGRCNLYEDCSAYDDDCPEEYEECVSYGPFEDCVPDEPICDTDSQCDGEILDVFDATSSIGSCDELCQFDTRCTFYTWYEDEDVCVLWLSCGLQDDACSECHTGMPLCES